MGMRWEQKGLSSFSLLMLLLLQLLQLVDVELGFVQSLDFEFIGAESWVWVRREFIEANKTAERRSVVMKTEQKKTEEL